MCFFIDDSKIGVEDIDKYLNIFISLHNINYRKQKNETKNLSQIQSILHILRRNKFFY